MSQQNTHQDTWIWSPNLQRWFFYDQPTDTYVFPDGSRVARRDVPRVFGTEVSFGYITDAFDTYTNVRTISQTEPKDKITDQSLLEEGGEARRMLQPTPDETEKLDGRFQVRKSPARFFCVGRVFLILWAEPAGETSQSIVSNSTVASVERYSTGVLGQPVHQKVRRFVVVREGTQYCTALPVMTYGGQGVAKAGVKKSDHAIIYSGRSPPEPTKDERPQRGEKGMRPNSIRVDPDDRELKLDSKSRIDFGKAHTVHHNLKVRPFGMVNGKSTTHLLAQFKAVIVEGISSKSSIGVATKQFPVQRNTNTSSTNTMRRTYGQVGESSQTAQRKIPPRESDDEDEDSSSEDDDDNDDE